MFTKKILFIAIAIFILFYPATAFASDTGDKTVPEYEAVQASWSDQSVPLGLEEAGVDILGYSSEDADISIQNIDGHKALAWKNTGGSVTFKVNVPKEGLYNICVKYSMLPDSAGIIERGLLINGKQPYKECSNFLFSNRYYDETYPFEKNSYGNEMLPRQTAFIGFFDQWLSDRSSMQTEPLKFYFKQGENSITFTALKGTLAISEIRLVPPTVIPNYSTYSGEHLQSTAAGFTKTLEAENILFRSGKNIQNLSISEPGVTPVSLGEKTLNVLGGDNYSRPHDFIEWKVEVPEDGSYQLMFKYKQNFNNELTSFRTLYVDGAVPFTEMESISFDFSSDWKLKVIGDKAPYNIHLTKGSHILRLEVTDAPYRNVAEGIRSVTDKLSTLDLYVKELIGKNVDIYRRWKIEEYIPDIKAQLTENASALEVIAGELENITGASKKGLNNLSVAITDLEKLAANPDNITKNDTALSDIYTVLSDWEANITTQPLLLDKLYIQTPEEAIPDVRVDFFKKLLFMLKSFFKSFTRASMQPVNDDPNTVQVWVQRNRDYVDLMQQLADEYYTKETGIKININYCPPGTDLLVLANASGKKPDIVTGVDMTLPFEFGVRNALVDLSQFGGFDDLIKNVVPGSRIPYKTGNAEYGIAEEVKVNVMFYRTDVLKRLDISVPETWDDTTKVLSTLLQNNYNFYYPYGDYLTFFFQRNVDIYTSDGTNIAFNNEKGYAAFRYWTDLFMKYGMYPRMASFYQHFRLGDVPIGITGIDQYMLLDMAAPDISGKWKIALAPGTIDENGKNLRWQAGTQNGIIMFKTSDERQQRAWDFMKWWMSTDTQLMYADDLENYYGPEFRYFSANLDVVDKQAWNDETKKVLLEQLRWYKQLPMVVGGSYMTSREIWNAWNRTVLDKKNYREQMDIAIDNIQVELDSKQKELGFKDQNGNALKQSNIFTIDTPE